MERDEVSDVDRVLARVDADQGRLRAARSARSPSHVQHRTATASRLAEDRQALARANILIRAAIDQHQHAGIAALTPLVGQHEPGRVPVIWLTAGVTVSGGGGGAAKGSR